MHGKFSSSAKSLFLLSCQSSCTGKALFNFVQCITLFPCVRFLSLKSHPKDTHYHSISYNKIAQSLTSYLELFSDFCRYEDYSVAII